MRLFPRLSFRSVPVLIVSLLGLLQGLQALAQSPAEERNRLPHVPQPIHGYVYARVNSDLAAAAGAVGAGVAVPDIEVTARNTTTGVTSAPVRSDPYGYFRTPAVAPGNYEICFSGTGYASSCDGKVVSVGRHVHVLDHIALITTKEHAVVGTVKLADGKTPCFWFDPAFDAANIMTARVALVDSNGNLVAGPIRGNSLGEYVVPTGAPAGNYQVTVECEAEKAAAAVPLTAASVRRDLVLRNHAPTAHLLEASKGGLGVRSARPGDVLKVFVPTEDLDHDVLHYRWVDDSTGSANFPDAPDVAWSAPPKPGIHALRVQVSDGRGGYSVSRTVIEVGPDQLVFSGRTIDRSTGNPVAAATITLNGTSVKSDSGGRFQVKVPDTGRFVLNANKRGFALTSRIFQARAVDVTVPMDAVQVASVDGSKGGPVRVKVEGCAPDQDTKPTALAASQRGCRKQAIGVLSFVFPPGALLAGSKPFKGKATVEAFQFDLTLPNAIPGDQSAKFKGADVRLQTFGAIHVQPRDTTGNPLRMASGKTVKVSMPIHPLAIASAPATIPFFSYQESTGTWVEHGVLTRAGANYVGTIRHFSAFNADTAFGTSSCVKLELDPNFPSVVRLNATYSDPSVGNFNHPDTVITDAHNPIVIERMVPSQDFTLVIDDNSAARNILQTVTLNSGPPVVAPYPVPPPYTPCNGPVTIHYNTVPTPPNFLITGTPADNSADYKTQTTTGDYAGRDTLSGWLSVNGFGSGAAETHAVYFNNGDLKFGRSMHCRSVAAQGAFTQPYVACYVSNYGNVGQDFSTQPDVLTHAYNGDTPAATVAMEYHPERTDKVQFWAFHGDGSYFPNPALDSQGNKPMPDICMACHQGTYGGPGTVANGSMFLPFDIDSFIGDDGNPLMTTLGSGAPRPTQADFRQLNQWAFQTSNVDGSGVSAAWQRLMDLWYKDAGHPTGVNDAAASYHSGQGAVALNTPPTGTAGVFPSNQAAYDKVVRPVCRTCHIARDPTFDTWDQLKLLTGSATLIQLYACGASTASPHFTMPHAEVPYKRFWQQSLSSTLASELFSAPNSDCSN